MENGWRTTGLSRGRILGQLSAQVEHGARKRAAAPYIVQPAAGSTSFSPLPAPGSGPIPGAEHRRGSDQKVPTSRNRKVLSGWKSGVAVWRNSIDRLNT